MAPAGPFTTSFLSICARVKDNRILPDGFLPVAERERIAHALGADEDLAQDVEPFGVGDDPDYRERRRRRAALRDRPVGLPASPRR